MTNETASFTEVEEKWIIYEAFTPFSQSAIWSLQNEYFKTAGINAWSRGEVPHHITCNPATGKMYAEIAFGFLRDCASAGHTTDLVYMLELGAGHGKFAYHFLKHLERLIGCLEINLPPFCYVLSDVAQANLDFWKTHPRLQPYFLKGWLDYALVDATKVGEIDLLYSGRRILRGDLKQPMVVVANYFFDSIPQELFYIEKKKIFRCLASISLPGEFVAGQQAGSGNPSTIFKQARLDYEYEQLEAMPYQESYLNTPLKDYTQKFDEAYLLYPDSGLRCLHQLSQFSQKGLMLLTADKGYHREEDAAMQLPPQLVTHGSFSLSANYNAVKKYIEGEGGVAYFPFHVNYTLNSGCLLLLKDHGHYRETQLAYQRFMHEFGPDELFYMRQVISQSKEISFRQIMSAIRMSAYDTRLFCEMLPGIRGLYDRLPENDKWTLYLTVQKAWDNYYPLGEDDDVAYKLADLLFLLHFFEEALVYLNLSEKLRGRSAPALHLAALCHCSMENYDLAMKLINEVLAGSPDDKGALELRAFLMNEKLVQHPDNPC